MSLPAPLLPSSPAALRRRRSRFDSFEAGVRLSAAEGQKTPGPLDDYWYGPVGATSAAGVHVTPDAAMRLSAVSACVRVLAESVAQLPVHVFQRTDQGKDRADDHPLARLVRKPNRRMFGYQFFETLTAWAALRGNGVALKVRAGGRVVELEPLHPSRLKIDQLDNLRLRYEYLWPDGKRERFTQDDVLHVPGLSMDGICGMSVVEYARNSIGIGLAAQEMAGRQMTQSPRMAGVLSHPKRLEGTAQENLRRSLEAQTSGVNAGRMMVLEEDMKWTPIGMSNKDAEFVATRQFEVTEIARWFRVPPHMIADLSRATYSNIEEQGRSFVVHTLMPWLKRWEGAIERDLIDDPDTYFAKFNADALQRGTTLSRAQADQIRLNSRVTYVNEVRERDDMNPVEWGDEPNIPQGAPPPPEPGAQERRPPPRGEDEDDEQAVAGHNRIRAHVNGNGAPR